MIREGFHVVLVGKPNVGKSSLFNALIGNDRAIVTPIPGTTRDYLQERIVVGNHLIYVIDTAGIHDSSEPVERLGIERSRERIERADLVVFVVDGSSQIDASDEALWKQTENRERVVVANKSDAGGFSSQIAFASQTLPVSAKTGVGVDTLLEWIVKRAEDSVRFSGQDSVISNLRHRDILKQSLECLDRAKQSLGMQMSEEFSLVDLHQAMNWIGEIVGDVTMDDIYQQIFSRFCIGK
jgi:tRNA modification GTPase